MTVEGYPIGPSGRKVLRERERERGREGGREGGINTIVSIFVTGEIAISSIARC